MKATITSTDKVLEISDQAGRRASARVWEGITEGGVEFVAYITLVQVRTTARSAEFDRDLVRSGPPSAETVRYIEARFII